MLLHTFFLFCIACVSSSDIFYGGSYKFLQELELSDKDDSSVGYQIRSSVVINQVHPELLSVELKNLELFGLTKKFHSTSPFIQETLKVDSSENHAYFIKIKDGLIDSIYVAQSENIHLLNLKKSLSSLLQFQTKPIEHLENDVSGLCLAKYQLIRDSTIHKVKSECSSFTGSLKENVFGGSVLPHRVTQIKFPENKLSSILYKEENIIKISIANISQIRISIGSSLDIIDPEKRKTIEKQTEGILEIIGEAEKKINQKYQKHKLILKEIVMNQEKERLEQLLSVVKENSKALKNEKLGKKVSSIAALKVLLLLKKASSDEILKTLKAKSSQKIIAQLLDILGAVQTLNSHEAAKKYLKLNSKDYNLDLCERYLWALSTSAYCNKDIIDDLLKFSENEISDFKLLETLIQTVASMSRKYVEESNDDEFLQVVLNFLSTKLEKCPEKDELCQRIYLKGLSNLESSKALELLVKYAADGPKGSSVRAMKAILKLGKNVWNEEVYKTAQRVLFSNGTVYDSSAKTLALDILLEGSESSSCFSKLFQIFNDRNASFELKQYLLQRLVQVSDRNQALKRLIKSSLLKEGLFHYNALAQGGLSTAFDRYFMENGYLSTSLEVKSGLLKQGFVHVNLGHEDSPQTVFTLGLFSNGLGSFVSDSESDEDENTETNAGLELTVLGVELRPFIFFSGQGELMGHVFSGTGSTLTPAYQALLLLNNEQVSLALGTGDLLNITFSSVASVDLSGKIEISLWSRAAESLVQNSVGINFQGDIAVNSPFVSTHLTQQLAAESQLNLKSDVQFSSNVAVCLHLEQPQTVVEYQTLFTTDAPGNDFKKQKSKIRKIGIPGRSYSLNSKNNEMCNAFYS